MYGLHDYARMIADRPRIEALRRALEATVKPGAVVVDVGAGTGILSVLACKLGARRVYAIEPNEAVEVAREVAADNGCADRVVLLREDALRVTLPERADVVVSDLRGGMPLATGNLPVIAHARERFLAPGGALVPASDTLFAAVVSSAAAYERAVGPAAAGDVTLAAMRARLANSVHRDRTRSIGEPDLLTPGAAWATLDYTTLAPGPVNGRARWRAERDAVGHGLLLWFEATLAQGVTFSTRPGRDTVYPQIFLPWSEPVAIRAGDEIVVDLWATAEGETWGWNATVGAPGGEARALLKQSTFLSAPARPGGKGERPEGRPRRAP